MFGFCIHRLHSLCKRFHKSLEMIHLLKKNKKKWWMGGIVGGWKSDERQSEESLPAPCTDPWEPWHIWTSVAPGKSEQIQFRFALKKKLVNLKIWFSSE